MSRIAGCIALLILVLSAPTAQAQAEPASPEAAAEEGAPAPPADAAPAGEQPAAAELVDEAAAARGEVRELTLAEMIRQGGVILWLIIGLSVVALILALFHLSTVTLSREAPQKFVKRAMSQLEAGDLRGAFQMCEDRDELVANVLRAGLKVSGHERYIIQEAMESEGERGAAALWQRISYLHNIGVIAPLLGLLGTVWGMIGAFGAIALDDASVKGLTMAYNVALAMITTAAGLMLAIPAMVVYFILRGRVVKIVSTVEAQSSEMVELLARGKRQ
jgi:biopolymer transport protein ExbB